MCTLHISFVFDERNTHTVDSENTESEHSLTQSSMLNGHFAYYYYMLTSVMTSGLNENVNLLMVNYEAKNDVIWHQLGPASIPK